MIKGSVHQEDIAILNIYMCVRVCVCVYVYIAKCVRQKLIELKGEIDKSKNMVGDFNIPLSTTDKILDQISARI